MQARAELLEGAATYGEWSRLARAFAGEDAWIVVPPRFVVWASEPEVVPPLAEDDESALRVMRAVREFWGDDD